MKSEQCGQIFTGPCLDLASPRRVRILAAFTCSLSENAPNLLAGKAPHNIKCICLVLQEIDREAPEGDVTAEHLMRMPYVEACIKEALRIYSPAALLGRQLGEDTVIKGHTIPKGTGVMVRVHFHISIFEIAGFVCRLRVLIRT